MLSGHGQVHGRKFDQVKGMRTIAAMTAAINPQQTDQYKRRPSHEHKGQLHGTVFFTATAPDPDKHEFGDDRQFKEEEQGEQIKRYKKAISSHAQQDQQKIKFFCQVADVPG